MYHRMVAVARAWCPQLAPGRAVPAQRRTPPWDAHRMLARHDIRKVSTEARPHAA